MFARRLASRLTRGRSTARTTGRRPAPALKTAALSAALWLSLLAAAEVDAATRYDPSLRFRVHTTPHFAIYFHQGEEALARRLAVIAERVHQTLAPRMQAEPRGRTHIILVDQTDQPNGWASPIPYNIIEVTAAWPRPGDLIGNTDDWLTLVFSHEYAHVLHLDRSEGWAGLLRRAFGRAPYVFPNLFLPLWQIEGIATFEETAVTGRGRLPAEDFAVIVDVAARMGRLEPLDRVNGGLVDWPAGSAHYAYGSYFHQYLAERFGEQALAAISEGTARRIPYTGSRAFRKVFGRSLGSLWRDFERDWSARAEKTAPAGAVIGEPRRLTDHGFIVAGPRFAKRGQPGDTEIVYSVENPRDFPAMFKVGLDAAPPVRLSSRFRGDRLAVGARSILFDQLELERSVALKGDLYEMDRETRAVRRLTRGRRLSDPDFSPDGGAVVCVMTQSGGRALVILDLASARSQADRGEPRGSLEPRILVSQVETQFGAPRWSPDGRWIAAERQQLNGPSEIVLVEVATGTARPLVSTTKARNVAPAWAPDGRMLIFASNRHGRPFNLFAIDAGLVLERGQSEASGTPLYQITDLPSGASSPDVSPDGAAIVYVGYTIEGYDLFTLPWDRTSWREVPGDDLPSAAIESGTAVSATGPVGSNTLSATAPFGFVSNVGRGFSPAEAPEPSGLSQEYSPWSTLLPRFWLPAVESEDGRAKLGAVTAGVDALGRHAYSAAVLWQVSGERVPAAGDRGRPDWIVNYAYDRWRPTLFTTASEDTSTFRVSSDGTSETQLVHVREREASAGFYLPFRKIRYSHALLAEMNYERDDIQAPSRDVLNRTAFRFGWSFNSARNYGYSISREQGGTAFATSEHVRTALGADGNADALTGDLRVYIRLGPPHAILAIRGGGAAAWGYDTARRVFSLGGSGPEASFFEFGRDVLSLMRGFSENSFLGHRLALVNLDYRVPLLRIQRGYGTLPVFVRALHGSIFADAGHAWNERFSARDLKTSVGAELSLDITAAYALPLTLVTGAAWGRDGNTGIRQVTGYVRLGRAF